jgi:hypothetical protein
MTRPCEQKWREYKLLRMLTLAEMVCRHDRRDVEDQHQYRQEARIYREIEDVPAATEESTSIQANLQADFNCENPQCSRVDGQ